MKANVLSRPLPNASLPRNSFPRGYMMNFNTSAGIILPVFCQFVPLGSKFRINRSIFMRSAEVNTAAFPAIDFDIDFYVVPCNLLMTRYDELKTNVQDVNSSVFDTHVPNLLPYFKVSDLAAVLSTEQGQGSEYARDIFGNHSFYGAERLLDYLGYDDYSISRSKDSGLELNSLKLQAYQKVYYDHFRNTAYEKNEPLAYNTDNCYTNNGVGRITDPYQLCKLTEIHYVNYRKDYFQAVYPGLNYVVAQVRQDQQPWTLPNSIVGAVQNTSLNINGTIGSDVGKWSNYTGSSVTPDNPVKTNSNGRSLTDSVVTLQHNHDFTGYASIAQDYQTLTNVQAIRAAFAMDKLLRASAYAPQHVKDQLEARYGVKLRKSYGHESTHIGSFRNSMVIGEVTSTANTSTGPTGDALGAIGGKGVSAQQSGKTITYTCESDSIVIGVMHGSARSMYDSHRIDAFNLKRTREDLPIPEFMDMGLRPLLVMELFNYGTPTANNHPIGYVTRDQEYKVGIDENHGLFREGQQLDIFSLHTNSVYRLGTTLGPSGILSTAAYFKFNPSDLDSLFMTSYDPTNQLTDQFFGQISFQFDCRQNMSVHGQPRL